MFARGRADSRAIPADEFRVELDLTIHPPLLGPAVRDMDD